MPEIYKSAERLDGILKLSAGDSTVHRLHPMAKMFVTVTFIVLTLSFQSADAFKLLPLWAYPVLLMALSDTPNWPIVKRMLIALPFPLFGAVGNLIILNEAAFQLGRFTVTLGLLSFFTILNKALLSVSSVLILAATTPLFQIQTQLIRLRVPKVLCLQLVLTYRYLTTLVDEASTMYTAYALRAPGVKGIRLRDIGAFLGQLLLKSFDRANRVYQAMLCRGFDGEYRGAPGRAARASDYAYALLLGAAFAVYKIVKS